MCVCVDRNIQESVKRVAPESTGNESEREQISRKLSSSLAIPLVLFSSSYSASSSLSFLSLALTFEVKYYFNENDVSQFAVASVS